MGHCTQRSLWTLKLCASDSFWRTLAFVLHLSSPETALEHPWAETPQSTYLVSSPAPVFLFMVTWYFSGFLMAKCMCLAVHVQGPDGDLLHSLLQEVPKSKWISQILECYFKISMKYSLFQPSENIYNKRTIVGRKNITSGTFSEDTLNWPFHWK